MEQKKIIDEIPHLIDAGFGRRLCIFTEIARHPDGVTVNDLTQSLGCDKAAIWHHLRYLVGKTLVSGRRVARNGVRAKVFRVTPFGIDFVQKEMHAICEIYSTVRAEMVNK